MFQERAYLDRNWEPSAFPPKQIDAVLLTHAHVDHCGLVPKLVQRGFSRPDLSPPPPSADLVELVLRDSAEIQAEDAAFKRKRHRKEGRQGQYPVKPLYTERGRRPHAAAVRARAATTSRSRSTTQRHGRCSTTPATSSARR